jgi:two-component system, sensor histidine kinase
VFELFVQVNPGLDRAQGGLGLGLTLVRNLVELHGGRVWAESEGRGRGSRFVLELPLAKDRAMPVRVLERAEGHPPIALRVLVAEDNDDAREFLADLLELWGHRVVAVEDGPGAVEAGASEPFDLALIDVGLPGLSGYQVAKELCQRCGVHRPYLVALTGYGQPEDRRRALEAGFEEHRIKPLEATELRQLLSRSAIRQQRHAEAAPTG